MKLKDRVTLVTGGGSGIGRAIALLFAEEGAHVVVNDLTVEAAEKTVEAMGSAKSRALALAADVSDSAQVRAMFATVQSRFGRLDVLVNNAGIPTPKEKGDSLNRKYEARLAEMAGGAGIQTHWDVTVETTDDEWLRLLAVNLNGTFFCSREALKMMNERNSGAIINLSSIVALGGMATGSAYAAAKGGVLSFTRALALEVASRNIRVNAICPGWVDTPLIQPLPPPVRAMVSSQIPLGRLAEPREIATTALFLASDDSSYITGQWISPNGGIYIG
jgi:3-oxoacyl-[acyl-carrier protein] reductase